MISRTTPQFWAAYRALPAEVQAAARKAYRLFLTNPHHPGLQFKKIRGALYSARVTANYRAIGWLQDNVVTWGWIGSHADYDRLLKALD